MKSFGILCVLAIIWVKSDASPMYDLKSVDSSGINRQRRTGQSFCQQASQAVGEVLEVSQGSTPGILIQCHLNVYANFDAFDPWERERFFCQFADLGTLSAFLDTITDDGLLYHLIRRAYNYMTVIAMSYKPHLLEAVESIDEYSWQDEEELKVKLDFFKTLESTGVLQHDPEGTDLILEAFFRVIMDDDFLVDYTPEPPSEEPFRTQVKELTNAMRKVWNLHVQEMSEWNPEYGQELRETIKNWTGLVVGNQNSMKSIVSDVLEAVNTYGLRGIIWIVVEVYDVPRYVVKKGYSRMMENMVSDVDSDVKYADNDYDAILAQIREAMDHLYVGLQGMGLFDLIDDL